MGYTYSTTYNSDNLYQDVDKKTVNMEETTPLDNSDNSVFVLSVDRNNISYHTDFQTVYDEALCIAKEMAFDIMIKHGSSFSVSVEEDYYNDDEYSVINVYTRSTNSINFSRELNSSILIEKLNKSSKKNDE